MEFYKLVKKRFEGKDIKIWDSFCLILEFWMVISLIFFSAKFSITVQADDVDFSVGTGTHF